MNITIPKQYDFLPRFFRSAIINILSNITLPLFGLISVGFLGHLDRLDYLAGVALYGTLFQYLYSVFSFLRMATISPTAQACGQDDQEEIILVGIRNALIAVTIGIAFLLLQYPLQQLWYILTTASPEVKVQGIAYFQTRIWGAPAVLLNCVLIGWFLGQEKSGKVLLLSLIGDTANVLLDYLMILHLNWRSAGAGLAQSLSQYLILLVSLILVVRQIDGQILKNSLAKLWNLEKFKGTFTFNSNFLVRSLAMVSTFAFFINISSAMGTLILTENVLLLRVAILVFFFIEGIGFATQTLTGIFNSNQDERKNLGTLLALSLSISLLIALTVAGICNLFPKTIFGILTNSGEVVQKIQNYVPWLFLLLGFNSISKILDSYFAGIGQGHHLRNASLFGALIGFFPLAGFAWHFQNNHFLLLALSLFMLINTLYFLIIIILENLEKVKLKTYSLFTKKVLPTD